MKSTILLKTDWIAQTAGIIVIVVLTVMGEMMRVLSATFIVLIWQFFSALTGVILTKGRDSSRTLFLFLFFMFISTFYPLFGFFKIVGVAVTTTLMIYYWRLTMKSLRRFRNQDGNFLKHIGF